MHWLKPGKGAGIWLVEAHGTVHFAHFQLEPIEGSSEKVNKTREEFRFQFQLGWWFSTINKLII